MVAKSPPPPVAMVFPAATNPDTDMDSSHFPPEKIELFCRRYDEGYDIPDMEYERWLKIAYPEAGASIAGMFQDVAPLNPVGERNDAVVESEAPLASPEMFSSPVVSR